MRTLATLVQEARARRGWTQEEAAEAMDVSRGWIGQLETGLIKRPRPPFRKKLEEHLGITREDMARAVGEIGPAQTIDMWNEIRRIAAISEPEDQEEELRGLPPEVLRVLEGLAVNLVRRTFRQWPAKGGPGGEGDGPR